MRILFLVLDFVMFAFRWLGLIQIVRLNPIPVPASCIVNLYRRGRQCHNANPVAIEFAALSQFCFENAAGQGGEKDRMNNHSFADDHIVTGMNGKNFSDSLCGSQPETAFGHRPDWRQKL